MNRHIVEQYPRGDVSGLPLLSVLLALVLIALECGAAAQDRPLVVESSTTTIERPWYVPVTTKETALMAARVATNEGALRLWCVPWERRENCRNDLGAIIQRARAAALRNERSIYDELRRHSPWATGLCHDLEWRDGGVRGNHPGIWDSLPRRCRRSREPGGNVRWTRTLGTDLRETSAWAAVTRLPWAERGQRREPPRVTWERTIRDALRLLEEPWSPCATDPISWAGTMDVLAPYMAVVDCGRTRNRFVTIAREGSPTVPAEVAAGRRGRGRALYTRARAR